MLKLPLHEAVDLSALVLSPASRASTAVETNKWGRHLAALKLSVWAKIKCFSPTFYTFISSKMKIAPYRVQFNLTPLTLEVTSEKSQITRVNVCSRLISGLIKSYSTVCNMLTWKTKRTRISDPACLSSPTLLWLFPD